MIAAKRFFAYLPSSEPDLTEMERLRTGIEALGYCTFQSSYLVGYVPYSSYSVTAQKEMQILHLTPGSEIRNRPELTSLKDKQNTENFAFQTLRLFNLLSCRPNSLELVSDSLNMLPYYSAQWNHGTVVCSSVRHMFAVCPGLGREIDDQGIFEFLCCGTPLGPRTLHKQLRLALAGQVIRWDGAKGLNFDRSGRTNVQPVNGGLAASFAADQIAAHIRDSFSKLPCPGLLPLTGGFDSRLIACFASALNQLPRMVTLGYSRHDEIRVAKAVARTFGSKTEVFPPPHPDVLDFVPEWLECLEGLADAHTLFMANLLSFPEAEGTPLYSGFIGDTLSGALLDRIPIETAVGPEQIARGAAAYFFGGISPQAGEKLQLSASVEHAVRDILDQMMTGLASHQTFTLWNLENIQRRLVGQQLLYVGQRFMPAPVFYYRPLLEFWLSVPRIALDNRTLLRILYQKHFPQLATLPHSEHVPSMIPRTRPALKYLSGWLLRRFRLRMARKLKLDTEKMEARSYIWSLWHGTTPQQRKRELESLKETFGLFQSQLGWNPPLPTDSLWPLCTSVERKQLLMLRRMYLLGEYAKSLADLPSKWPSARAGPPLTKSTPG